MIPSTFDYQRAGSVAEAVKLLGEGNGDAKLLAGGHSLIPALKLRLNSPGKLIDIARIQELKYIKDQGDHIAIGAASTHYEIETSAVVKTKAPALAQAAAVIGDPQVRNMGTIGGSLAHADPAADYPAPILALGATIVARGPDGEREIEAADFFVDLFMTSLAPDEIITELRIPAQPAGTGSAYVKFPHPASRFPVVGCAARIKVSGGNASEVRVAFTGIANTAFREEAVERALNGKAVNATTISSAAENAASQRELNGDHFASAAYRRQLAKVFAKRALLRAIEGL